MGLGMKACTAPCRAGQGNVNMETQGNKQEQQNMREYTEIYIYVQNIQKHKEIQKHTKNI